MMRLAAMPSLERGFIRPSRQQQKHRWVCSIRQDLETAKTSRFLHQTGTVKKGPAHFLLQAVANPKAGYHGDHAVPPL
jgi:hypothetical protein